MMRNEFKEFRMLLLGGGKRVSLARAFQRAASSLGLEASFFAYEKNNFEPIGQIAETISGKARTQPGITEDLESIARRKEIHLVTCHVDPLLQPMALVARDNPALAVSNSPELTGACFSKEKFQDLCEERRIRIAPRWNGVSFPLIAKPNLGSASRGVEVLVSKEDLNLYQEKTSEPFISQDFIEGDEFTVDAYVNRDGLILAISPRIRLKVVGGEVVESRTVIDEALISATTEVIQKIGLVGPLSIQFVRDGLSGEDFLIEVNTRFGGGIMNSIAAGVDFPKILLQDHLGEPPDYQEVRREIHMKRYFAEVYK